WSPRRRAGSHAWPSGYRTSMTAPPRPRSRATASMLGPSRSLRPARRRRRTRRPPRRCYGSCPAAPGARRAWQSAARTRRCPWLGGTRRGRVRPIATMTLLASADGPSPNVAIAGELAHRAAMAIDSARLSYEAQQAIRVRDEFLSIASHELRTPLTPLRLQIQDLAERARTAKLLAQPMERVTARLENAARQVDRMPRLVSTLLDVTRIVAGRIVLEREPVELVALVREVLDRAEPEVQRANYRIQFAGAGPLVGHWDRLRIDQVLTNLVSNAMKYGGGKPIEISVRRGDGSAILRVCDHGIGIPREQLERIFGRFERAVSERSYGGLGLGLYIVRRFVEAHGGTVRVESQVGEGSVFIVELPLA